MTEKHAKDSLVPSDALQMFFLYDRLDFAHLNIC